MSVPVSLGHSDLEMAHILGLELWEDVVEVIHEFDEML